MCVYVCKNICLGLVPASQLRVGLCRCAVGYELLVKELIFQQPLEKENEDKQKSPNCIYSGFDYFFK